MHQDRRWEEEQPRSPWRWVAGVVLLGALGIGGFYGYRALQSHDGLLAELPGMRQTLDAAARRVGALEEKLLASSEQWSSLAAAVGELKGNLRASTAMLRRQNDRIGEDTRRRLREEMGLQTKALQARLKDLEAQVASEQARVSQLEQTVASARRQTSQEVARLEQDRVGDRAHLSAQVNRLDRQMEGGRSDLAAFARTFDRRRIDFEAGLNHAKEVAPGVNLTVTHTDIGRQRYNGWVFLMPDRRTLWIQGRGLQQPLAFYSGDDGKPREVVITRVTKYSVIGHVNMPAAPASVARVKPGPAPGS